MVEAHKILIVFLHSELGNSSLANDLVAGHSLIGLSSQVGPFCQRDPSLMKESAGSDLVKRSAMFSFDGI